MSSMSRCSQAGSDLWYGRACVKPRLCRGRGRASLQLGELVGGCSRGWSLGQRNGAQLAVSTGRNAADVHRVPDLGGLSAETSGLAAAERVHNGTQQGPQAASVDLFTWGGRVETGNKGWKEAREVPGAGWGTEALSRNGADESLGTEKRPPPVTVWGAAGPEPQTLLRVSPFRALCTPRKSLMSFPSEDFSRLFTIELTQTSGKP